jgi:isochorismate synthase
VTPIAALADLRGVVEDAIAAANREGRIRWIASRSAAPNDDPLRLFAAGGADRFFWERPSKGAAIGASGVAAAIDADGAQRFSDAAGAARALYASLHLCGDAAPDAAGPLLVGGFACTGVEPDSTLWAGFPSGRLVLPARTTVRTEGTTWRTIVERIEPGADAGRVYDALLADVEEEDAWSDANPEAHAGGRLRGRLDAAGPPVYRARADRPTAAYSALVESALGAIGAGEFEKVVVARAIRVDCDAGFAAAGLLDALREAYPSCATFGVARGDATFLGSTPERLLRLDGRQIETAALAGTAPRGRNPEEDAQRALELIESKKEQSEHAVVVRELREALAPLCSELRAPEAPELLRLESLQHLETPISGTLARETHLLDLASRLHPTSAVAGAPREAALRWLASREALERGWYGGAVGFVDASGGGELSVALRSALLRGDTAHLFVGAGIVEGSQPRAELQETRLKLRALLTPLLEI